MIKEALDLPLNERDQLMAKAGYFTIVNILVEVGMDTELAATAAGALLDAEMEQLLSDHWEYNPEF
jgi:hypothetical protein